MKQLGRYGIDGPLGEGGMATVFRGSTAEGEPVALKVLTRDRRADVPGLRDRLHREADVLQALQHIPAVVGFVEVFEDEETAADVLVLEFVEGQTLGDRYRRDQPGVQTVVEWMGHVCHAMHDIHEAGFVHRDLKPDNLLLTNDSAQPVKIIDFNSAGKASKQTGPLTRVQGAFPHTPAYLAPECFDGVPPDASADVYALGITFSELLIGRHPLLQDESDDTTHSRWHQAHENEPFPHLPTLNHEIPDVLQEVLARACAKERSDRIPDAVVLWSELKRVWEAMQAPVPAESPDARAAAPVRPEKRYSLWLLACIAVLSTLGGGLAMVQLLSTSSQLHAAQSEIDRLERQLLQRDAPTPMPETRIQNGITIEDIAVGTGARVPFDTPVTAAFRYIRADGTVLRDQTDPPGSFTVSRSHTGLEGMRVGSARRLILPPNSPLRWGPATLQPTPTTLEIRIVSVP